MYVKKTKIICTISNNNCEPEFLRQLYEAGMNVVRINSAHASLESAQKITDNVRKVSDDIAILIDTKGPEIRLTDMDPEEGIKIKAGDTIEILKNTDGTCNKWTLFTNCKTFVNDVPEGARILIDDGEIELSVEKKTDYKLMCRAANGGTIKGHKSLNVPDVFINLPSVSERDFKFINWAIDADIDFIAHSFVRSKKDLDPIHELLDKRNSHLKIISKIENQAGVDNLEDIINNCYGVMVARGDLGVEIPAEKIPVIQRNIIRRCRERKKPVIIATQMLYSMTEHPRPTRAEVTDVSNAIFQSTDAIMLSGETAFGKYPVESVKTMCKIAKEAESEISVSLDINLKKVSRPVTAVLAKSLVAATQMLPIKAIIFDTQTGRTGRYLSEFRPKIPIFAMCYFQYTKRELALSYDVYPFIFQRQKTKDEYVKKAIAFLESEGRIKNGDMVGIVGGSFFEDDGASFIEIKQVGLSSSAGDMQD